MYCTCHSNRSRHAMEPYIGSESRFLPTSPAFDAPVKGVSVGIRFGAEKLEWFGYTRRSMNFEDTVTRFDRIHERDGQTDTQTPLYDLS